MNGQRRSQREAIISVKDIYISHENYVVIEASMTKSGNSIVTTFVWQQSDE